MDGFYGLTNPSSKLNGLKNEQVYGPKKKDNRKTLVILIIDWQIDKIIFTRLLNFFFEIPQI